MSMLFHPQKSIRITDRSSIGEARRIASQIAERSRLKETEVGQVSLIVTELATNLLLHATDGEIIIRMLPQEENPGVEIIALDHGPGIADLQRCMTDGYSTGGTRGCGLGAVQRLSTSFDIYSTQPAGTIVMSRILSDAGSPRPKIEFSAISVPAPGETECGDAWQLKNSDNNLAAIVVDGLGHGPLAAIAAAEALAVFGDGQFDAPARYFAAAQSPLSTTRGAAIGFVHVDLNQHSLAYMGVGNIVGSLIGLKASKVRSLPSHNGIVGLPIRKLQQFDFQWEDGDLLIIHSDGLTTHWNLPGYPGLGRTDTAVIAAALYRDAKRGSDDATVLVVRLSSS
jgi:anti-sigma regulatory factor (Ser/Thr protein kinase)